MSTDVQLGRRYRDTITSFEGVAVGRFEYLHGCVRWQLIGVSKDGEPRDFTFDEPQLDEVATEVVHPATGETGGPRDTPRRFGL